MIDSMDLRTRSNCPMIWRQESLLAAVACNKFGSSNKSGITYTKFRITISKSLKTPLIGCRSRLYGGRRREGMPLFQRNVFPPALWMGALSNKTTQLFDSWIHGRPGTYTPSSGMSSCRNNRQSADISAPFPTTTDWKPKMRPSHDTVIVVLVRGTDRRFRPWTLSRSRANARSYSWKTSPPSLYVSANDTMQH